VRDIKASPGRDVEAQTRLFGYVSPRTETLSLELELTKAEKSRRSRKTIESFVISL
ncbi:uncharacterized, partial [Tachysurus ichikawai]